MADIPTIADYIYRRAIERGVNPDMALGIARQEGLNDRTINSPTFGNADTRGYSFGPFQLFSASRDPRNIAPGGMAHEFRQQYGANPNRDNWQQQVDFSIDRMRDRGTGAWYAVRDAGGVEPITTIGRDYARSLNLNLPGSNTYQGAEANPGRTETAAVAGSPQAVNPMAQGYQGAEANPGNTFTPPPVYGSDIGTSLRRLGNWIAPDMVDPATPLTPEQIKDEKEQALNRSIQAQNVARAQGNFGRVAAAGMAAPMEAPNLRPQVVGPRQFQPLQPFNPYQRQRGLLD